MDKAAIYQQIAHAFTHQVPFSKYMGMNVVHLDASSSIIELDMFPELVGNYSAGILHGGVIASLLDTVMSTLALSSAIEALPEPASEAMVTQIVTRAATVDLRIDYLQPGRGSRFIGKASVVHVGRTLSTMEARVFSEDDVLIASGMGKFKIT